MTETSEQCWARIRSQRKFEEIRKVEEAREMILHYANELKKWKQRLEVAEDELRVLGCSEKYFKTKR